MGNIGDRIKEAREIHSISQAELARRAELTPAAISQFESGEREPSYASLKRLASSLEVSMDYLAGKEDAPSDVQVLFRDLKNITEEDKKLMRQMYNMLKEKNKSKK